MIQELLNRVRLGRSREVRSRWRQFSVTLEPGLRQPYLIDEKGVSIHLRRDLLRPWRMVETLIDAMNEIVGRDDTWAYLRNGRTTIVPPEVVRIAGKPWAVSGCSVLNEGKIKGDHYRMVSFQIDEEKRSILLSTRCNLAFAGPALIQEVGRLYDQRLETLSDEVYQAFERLTDQQAAVA